MALHTSLLTHVAYLSSKTELQTRERTLDDKQVFFTGLFYKSLCRSLLALHTFLLTYVAYFSNETEVQTRERNLADASQKAAAVREQREALEEQVHKSLL